MPDIFLSLRAMRSTGSSPELEHPQHHHTTAAHSRPSLSLEKPCAWLAWLSGASCRSLSHDGASMSAAAPGCSRFLQASRCCSHRSVLRAAARIARLGNHTPLVPCVRTPFARGCSWLHMASHCCSRLHAASLRLAPTRPQVARPDEPIAHTLLRLARSCAWSRFGARG
jgi:hypothetical protein